MFSYGATSVAFLICDFCLIKGVTVIEVNPQPHQRTFLECNGTKEKDPIRIVFFGGGAN